MVRREFERNPVWATNAGLYGCKFDTDGNPTTCGAATINNQTGDIDVAVAQQ